MTASISVTRSDVEDLYRRHADELRGYLYRRAGEAGADLLGEVFVIALRRSSDLPEPELRRAWLFGTARRLLLAAHRTTVLRQHAEAERTRWHDPATDTSDAGHAQQSTAVNGALDSLKEKDRELIRLTEWEQLPIVEAAAVLGVSPGAARVRLHRARKALAEHPALRDLLDD